MFIQGYTNPNKFKHAIYRPKQSIYKFCTKSKTCITTGLKPRILCIPASCLDHYATSIHANIPIFTIYLYILPGRWCCTSGAGPAAPPCPAMTSLARSSRSFAVKPGQRGLRPHWRATLTWPGSSQVDPMTLPCVKSTGKYQFRVKLSGTIKLYVWGWYLNSNLWQKEK